ncbi:hypothetical protein GCM10027515_08750 [Schumannella luteola]|uniref:Uncharacterized protein n=1 Tax=Schumannella luteola TaxID=472059 RepID=A0A852Y4Z2_9MICO|nr:hypothetical protein [Schumannella luteola]NYG97996.1 hypothetical protein [Schumannella luteola]TPX01731.1 hypothetical protein FJ656_25375 [Schumannella luteola]
MAPNYTVIENPHLTASPVLPARRTVESGDAIAILTDRQFHVFGDMVLRALDHIDPYSGGAFVTGVYAAKRIHRLRPAHDTLPLIVEPEAMRKHLATEIEPFRIDIAEGELFAPTLDAALDIQRLAGSDLAITPSGQIRTGDSATLKAALRQANALDRRDVLFAVVLEAGWLSQEHLANQVIQVLNRSRHPVLLTFVDRKNPVESMLRQRSYARIFEETTGIVVAYRTDMTGFVARSRGAIAAAIGAYPRMRRMTPVGERGSAIDPEDMSPHMLIADMLRFVRSTHMRREWFAAVHGINCFCDICRGAAIDRLHGSNAERELGHLHGMEEVGRIHSTMVGLSQPQIADVWRKAVAGALDTYPQLEAHVGAPIKIPNDLKVWAEF